MNNSSATKFTYVICKIVEFVGHDLKKVVVQTEDKSCMGLKIYVID